MKSSRNACFLLMLIIACFPTLGVATDSSESPPSKLNMAYATKSWEQRFGTARNIMTPTAVQETTDKGFAVCGTMKEGVGAFDHIYLLRLNYDGQEVWQQNYANDDAKLRAGWLQQTTDGGFIIVGEIYGADRSTTKDMYLLKVDSHGTKQWESTFGGKDFDWGASVVETKEGEYVAVGATYTQPKLSELFVIKVDKQGRLIWQKAIGGQVSSYGDAVHYTKDGSLLIVGECDRQMQATKVDGEGRVIWQKTLRGGEARRVVDAFDGGYVIGGCGDPFAEDNDDLFLIHIDDKGGVLWEKQYPNRAVDFGFSICQTGDMYFIASTMFNGEKTGWFGAGKEGCCLAIDRKGSVLWECRLGNAYNWSRGVIATRDGDCVVLGEGMYEKGGIFTFLIKLAHSDKKDAR